MAVLKLVFDMQSKLFFVTFKSFFTTKINLCNNFVVLYESYLATSLQIPTRQPRLSGAGTITENPDGHRKRPRLIELHGDAMERSVLADYGCRVYLHDLTTGESLPDDDGGKPVGVGLAI